MIFMISLKINISLWIRELPQNKDTLILFGSLRSRNSFLVLLARFVVAILQGRTASMGTSIIFLVFLMVYF